MNEFAKLLNKNVWVVTNVNKLTSQGKTFVKIDRWYPSSKTCSVCGLIKDDLTLADRSWTCSGCGTTHNRDHNAAINIRNVGLLGLYPA